MADPIPTTQAVIDERRSLIAAWLIAFATLLFVLRANLLPGLLGGLLVYELVHLLAPRIFLNGGDDRRKIVAVALVAGAVVFLLTGVILGLIAFFRSDAGSLPDLLRKMAQIIDGSIAALPDWMRQSLPGDAEGVRLAIVHWIRAHAAEVQLAGKDIAFGFAHVLVGMVIGAMVSLREAAAPDAVAPLARALAGRAARLGEAFRQVVFAQIRIAALNAVFTGLYLAVILPLFGVHLPLVKTMIAITFVAGLLPVLGNLVSNTVIVVISLNHSPSAALGSLGFLVAVHKFEYFLNARIVGASIRASAWELLLAMLVMESAFGLAGLVAAPVFYAYLKGELAARGLV